MYSENFPCDFHGYSLKLRSDRNNRRLLCNFLLTSTLFSLLPFAMPRFSQCKLQQHQSTCASVLLVCGYKAEHLEEPQKDQDKNHTLRLKNMDYQLHSSGFEKFLLCNYFSHRCQCHNKYMKSNKPQHKDTNFFIALKIEVCSKPVLVFKLLPFIE